MKFITGTICILIAGVIAQLSAAKLVLWLLQLPLVQLLVASNVGPHDNGLTPLEINPFYLGLAYVMASYLVVMFAARIVDFLMRAMYKGDEYKKDPSYPAMLITAIVAFPMLAILLEVPLAFALLQGVAAFLYYIKERGAEDSAS